MTQKTINLFNPALLPPKVVLPARWFPWALCAGVIACFLLAQVQAMQSRAAAAQAQSMQAQMVPLQAQSNDLQKQLDSRKPDAKLQQENRQLESRLQMRQQALVQLRSEGQSTGAGYTPQLVALAHQSNPGVWLTRIQFASDQLTLEGRTVGADKLPSWLDGLRKEQSFSGTHFSVFDVARPLKEPAAKADGKGGEAKGVADTAYAFTLKNQREEPKPDATGDRAP